MTLLHEDQSITEIELRRAFQASHLWNDRWTYQRATNTPLVLIGLKIMVMAMRRKYQQKNGTPVPVQQPLEGIA